jgi:hypothetical protein
MKFPSALSCFGGIVPVYVCVGIRSPVYINAFTFARDHCQRLSLSLVVCDVSTIGAEALEKHLLRFGAPD